MDIAGTRPPLALNGPLIPGGDVGGAMGSSPSYPPFQFTPDSRAVVYVADQDRDGIVELYASPLP